MSFDFLNEHREFARDKSQKLPRGFRTIAKIGYLAASYIFSGEAETYRAYSTLTRPGVINESTISRFQKELDAFNTDLDIEDEINRDLERYRSQIERNNPGRD